MTAAIGRIDAGGGRVVVRRHGSDVVFSELSSTYPLKLLSTEVEQDGLAVVYALTYGGGLVGGDSVALAVDVGPSSALVLLTQARNSSEQRHNIVYSPQDFCLAGLDKGVQDPV